MNNSSIDIEFNILKERIINDLNEIYDNNFKKITDEEPLLFLLSMCDTIEFIKKVSNDNGKTSETRITTLSQTIEISVDENKISIQYNDKNNRINMNYDNWANSINELQNWINVTSSFDQTNKIISIMKEEENEKK